MREVHALQSEVFDVFLKGHHVGHFYRRRGDMFWRPNGVMIHTFEGIASASRNQVADCQDAIREVLDDAS